MNSTTEEKKYNNPFPDGPIDVDEMEEICRRYSYSQFQIYVNNASYSEVSQVREELVIRAGRIKIQLENRSAGESWRKLAVTALDIINNKLKIAQLRVDQIRRDNISNLMLKHGGLSHLNGNRLVFIKILLDIIDRNNRVKFTAEELSALDVCRSIGNVPENLDFNGLSYNPVRSSINLENGTEVATVNTSFFMSEEYGYRFAAVDEMRRLLARSESMANYLGSSTSCKENGEHNPSKCTHCFSDGLRKDITALMSRIR